MEKYPPISKPHENPKPQKSSNCQKGFVSPDPFRLYKDSWMIPSEMPPSKVTEKWAHLIGDSIPYPTEEIPRWTTGASPTRLTRGRSTHGKAAARRRFFVGPELRSLTSFFRRKRVHWQHSKSINLEGRFFLLHREHPTPGLCCSFDAKKNIPVSSISSSRFSFHTSIILKDSEKTSHHRKGPKASISHKVSASPLGNTTPTTLPNIVSWQVTMRRAPPDSIRWMWPQRGLFRGSGSKPIRTCFQQWEVVVF